MEYGWNVNEKQDALSGERIRQYRHSAGFCLDVLPKPGYAQKFASIAIPYGSIHSLPEEGAALPAGTAHYLEHCAFTRDEQGGLLARLSALGASANAYTTHTHTLYYFTAVDAFAEALFTYFDAVVPPVIDEERVEAERGIIQSEIRMYQDDPDSRAYNAMLENLFVSHPVRTDIAGSVDSVAAITAGMLQDITARYYQPNTVRVTVVGDVDEPALLAGFEKRLNETPAAAAPEIPVTEPTGIGQAETRLNMDVGVPTFLLGIKDPSVLPQNSLSGIELAERKLSGQIMAEVLAGPSSPLYNKLYDAGLINESFGISYVCESNFAYFVAGGEAADPERTVSALSDGLADVYSQPIDSDLFEAQKRAAAGDFLRSMDRIRSCGMQVARASLSGLNLFETPRIYDRMNPQKAMKQLAFLTDRAQQARVFVTHPEEAKKEGQHDRI